MKKLVFMITAILITTLMIVLIGVMALMMTTPACASTAHDLAMSYILADQDRPKVPGDKLYTSEIPEKCPILLDTTAYCSGTHGSHGDKMQRGHVAYMESSYGTHIELYEAIPEEDGTYSLGKFIGQYQVKDCGYGKKTGVGRSRVRPDKGSLGSIETGETVDVYFPEYAECKEWMTETQGRVFALFINDVKG